LRFEFPEANVALAAACGEKVGSFHEPTTPIFAVVRPVPSKLSSSPVGSLRSVIAAIKIDPWSRNLAFPRKTRSPTPRALDSRSKLFRLVPLGNRWMSGEAEVARRRTVASTRARMSTSTIGTTMPRSIPSRNP